MWDVLALVSGGGALGGAFAAVDRQTIALASKVLDVLVGVIGAVMAKAPAGMPPAAGFRDPAAGHLLYLNAGVVENEAQRFNTIAHEIAHHGSRRLPRMRSTLKRGAA